MRHVQVDTVVKSRSRAPRAQEASGDRMPQVRMPALVRALEAGQAWLCLATARVQALRAPDHNAGAAFVGRPSEHAMSEDVRGCQFTHLTSDSKPSLLCPRCRHWGHFEAVLPNDGKPEAMRGAMSPYSRIGFRRCPDNSCGAVVYVVWTNHPSILYPPVTLDFDPTDIPESIVATFKEALLCNAHGCYVAAAVLVRKTLEVLCSELGATGNNLAARVASLSSKVILPPELLAGLTELRLLGNDAAHVESKSYDQIGTEELSVAIEFTREVLKATFQYGDIVRRLQALRK